MNVSWAEAQAFCAWLTGHERKGGRIAPDLRYRLPTDHEWSCAADLGKLENAALSPAQKAGKLDALPWGIAWPPPPGSGNYSGEEAAGHEQWRNQTILAGYRDAFPTTAPVGSFPANALGLFDLSGNAWEWCEDLYERPEGTGDHHAMRGGSFFASHREDLLLSRRYGLPVVRDFDLGFRVVLSR